MTRSVITSMNIASVLANILGLSLLTTINYCRWPLNWDCKMRFQNGTVCDCSTSLISLKGERDIIMVPIILEIFWPWQPSSLHFVAYNQIAVVFTYFLELFLLDCVSDIQLSCVCKKEYNEWKLLFPMCLLRKTFLLVPHSQAVCNRLDLIYTWGAAAYRW